MTTPTLRALGAALLDLLLPGSCGGCGLPGPGWCPRCAARVEPSSPVLPGGPAVVAVGRYRGPLRAALLAYKERGRRDLAAPLARLLAGALADLPLPAGVPPGGWWLVPAPSRPATARARGGDHVLRLCRHLARADPRLRVAPALALHRGARDSVGLDATARAANLAGRLRVRAAALPPAGAAVLLVDDVVTTGATLRACRAALAKEGRHVIAAVVLTDATRGQHQTVPGRGSEKTTHCRTCVKMGSLDHHICCRTVISDTVGTAPSGTPAGSSGGTIGALRRKGFPGASVPFDARRHRAREFEWRSSSPAGTSRSRSISGCTSPRRSSGWSGTTTRSSDSRSSCSTNRTVDS